jgi:hypothetical protein
MTPKTSLRALQHMEQSGKRLSHAETITACLESGFSGNYEAIAIRCGLTPMQVTRRLSECPNIRKSGKMSQTSSKQLAEVWEYYKEPVMTDLKQGNLFAA